LYFILLGSFITPGWIFGLFFLKAYSENRTSLLKVRPFLALPNNSFKTPFRRRRGLFLGYQDLFYSKKDILRSKRLESESLENLFFHRCF